MTEPLHQGLAELFYAAGGCAEQGDLKGVNLCLNALRPILAEVDARLFPVKHEVVLQAFGGTKIQVIKAVRGMCPGLGLKEAKELVESAPATVLTVPSKEDAEVYAQRLRNAGAQAEVRAPAL